MEDKIDALTPKLFLDGPGEFLVSTIACLLIADPRWHELFGNSIENYDREDFSMRELPALRIYSLNYTKETDSHYINGEVKMDVILPPLVRRAQTETVQSQIASALLQQFRRERFFQALRAKVPGLNELGKTFTVDKSLGFQNSEMGEEECPATHISLNFRIDLKEWDAYLEKQGRTKDDPFEVTLSNLKSIGLVIQGTRADNPSEVDITLGGSQVIGG